MKKHTILSKGSIFLLIVFSILASTFSFSQVAVNSDNSPPDPKAMLDVKSTSRGFLIPRMTQPEIIFLPNPADGLTVFCTDDNKTYVFSEMENTWKAMRYGTGIISYCGKPFTDTRDGQVYKTVMIGDQCWMQENLNIGTRINGAQEQTDNGIMEKYCYNDLESNCDIYGGIYQWDEIMHYLTAEGVQGICPAGWHIPTDAEWSTLSTFLGGQEVAGGKMKSTGTIEEGTGLWRSPNTDATNESGFTAVPAGMSYRFGPFFGMVGAHGYWWSSSEKSTSEAWLLNLCYFYGYVHRHSNCKYFGFSVRCLRN